MSQLARAWQVIREEGVGSFTRRLAKRIVDVRTQLLLECSLRQAPLEHRSPVHGLRLFWAGLSDLDRFPSLELLSSDTVRRDTHARLERGDRCLVGTFNDTAVTYLWVTFSRRDLPGLSWPVGAGSAFVYKTFTIASMRGRRFNRSALAWAQDECRRERYHTLFVDVDRSNEPSLKALRYAGFSDCGSFRIWKLGPFTFTRISRELYCRVTGQR
jgi:hypothetical protein